jgi:hypothetical protein
MTAGEEDLNKLITLFDQAEEMAAKFHGGSSEQFHSVQEFNTALKNSIFRFRQGDTSELNKLFNWFSPARDWDAFCNLEGIDLGNEVYEILLDWMVRNKD